LRNILREIIFSETYSETYSIYSKKKVKNKGERITKMTIYETVKLCNNCTATGHYASECKMTREELYERHMAQKTKAIKKCGKCGNLGHNRRTCKT
jgi:hypothetical protein